MARVSWPSFGELEPAGMPQHVGMHEEREFRRHARPGNHALISGYGQRRVTLRDEDVWGRWGFAQELAQRAAFPRRYRMHAGNPALGPAYMQAPGGEVDVVPAQCHQLRGSRSTSRSVRYSRLRLLTVTFTEVGAASPSREFSMETALPPVRTVTDLAGGVTDLDGVQARRVSSGGASKRWGSSAGGLLRRYQSPQDDIKVFQISSTEEAKEDGVLH
jgi:hypothetical protein